MQQSSNLTLPYIMPAQAQKHVTHNEAIRMLDSLVQLAVLDRDLATPPGEPDDGDRYIVAEAGTGEWSGRDGDIAARQDGAWAFFAPRAGWLAWVADEARLLVFDGAGWVAAGTDATGAATFGVNAAADETNRLAVAAAATLLNHEGAGHQLKINKLAPEDTASLLFQTDFSGRAEMGIAGKDDFHVKVSPDGAQWIEAIAIDGATGAVTLPHTPGREPLAAPRTYYVRTDGDDGNDGLADSAGGAFATIQKAVDTVAALDLGIHDVTVQIGDGTYSDPVALKSLTGAGSATLRGDPGSPADVTIAVHGATIRAISAAGIIGDWRLDGLCLTTTGTGGNSALIYAAGSTTTICFQNMDFGPTQGRQIFLESGAFMSKTGPCFISGGGNNHLFVRIGALYDSNTGAGNTTFIGDGLTASFANFASCSTNATIYHAVGSYVNADNVTGARYSVQRNAVVQTPNGSASYFPGSENGTTDSGGHYV